jgi:hypothetical protein
MPKLAGHEPVIFGPAWIQPMDTRRAPIRRVWVTAKVEPLSEPEQHSVPSAPAQCTVNNGPSRCLSASGSWKLYPYPHFNSYTQYNLEHHYLHVKHCHTWTEITFTKHLCIDGATKSPLQLEMEVDVDVCRCHPLTISHSAYFWGSYLQSRLWSKT